MNLKFIKCIFFTFFMILFFTATSAEEKIIDTNDLITKYSKRTIVDFLNKNYKDITVQVGNKLYIKTGSHGLQYVTIDSINNDFNRFGISVEQADIKIAEFLQNEIAKKEEIKKNLEHPKITQRQQASVQSKGSNNNNCFFEKNKYYSCPNTINYYYISALKELKFYTDQGYRNFELSRLVNSLKVCIDDPNVSSLKVNIHPYSSIFTETPHKIADFIISIATDGTYYSDLCSDCVKEVLPQICPFGYYVYKSDNEGSFWVQCKCSLY